MKMKIFKGSDLQSLESKINEWPEAKGINLIHHITHANNLGSTIITVWWGSRDWFTIRSEMTEFSTRYFYFRLLLPAFGIPCGFQS
jgi:hypothetical protein